MAQHHPIAPRNGAQAMVTRSKTPRPTVALKRPARKKRTAPPPPKLSTAVMRERFVAEYVLDHNATQAAIRAGYSPHTAYSSGQRLLKRDEIKQAISARQQEVLAPLRDRYEITTDKIQRELALLAFSNPADFITVDEDGQAVIDLSEATRDQFAAIQSVKSRRTRRTVGDVDIEERTTELRLLSKRDALVDLARIHGLFKEEGGVQQTVRFIVQWGKGPTPEPYDDEIIEGEAA